MCAAFIVPIVKSDYRLYPSMPRNRSSRLSRSTVTAYSHSNPDLVRHETVDCSGPNHRDQHGGQADCSSNGRDVSCATVKDSRRWSEATNPGLPEDDPQTVCDIGESENHQMHYYYRRGQGGVSVGGLVNQRNNRSELMPSTSYPSKRMREEKLRQILAEKARERRIITYSESRLDHEVDVPRRSTSHLASASNFAGNSLIKLLRHVGLATNCKNVLKTSVTKTTDDEEKTPVEQLR